MKLLGKLKTTEFTLDQAETVVCVIAEAQDELATKKDLVTAFAPMRINEAVLRTEITQIEWMLGFVIAGIAGILAKVLSH